MFRLTLIIATCIATVSFVAVAADKPHSRKAASSSSDAAAQLAGLAWMEGVWVRHQGKDTLEESWFAPQGDSMVGMFRWMKGDKLWMVELMTITIDEGQLVFRLRHFDRKQTPWEEKNAPMTCKLKSQGDRKIVFERTDGEKAGMGYVISSSGPDSYEVSLLEPGDQSGHGQKFDFKRKSH